MEGLTVSLGKSSLNELITYFFAICPKLLSFLVSDSSIEDRLYRLEKNLEFLYQMPPGANPLTSTGTGTDRQGGAPAGPPGQPGAGGNDMWQIIQLNNRVVSCETALQKV